MSRPCYEIFTRNDLMLQIEENLLRKRERLLGWKEKRLEERLLQSRPVSLKGNSLGLEGKIGLLLPGIPNEITLDLITTKLSWRDCHRLKSISAGWYSALRDWLVYDTRVHFQSTQTFVLMQCYNGSLALRCSRDNSYFELPKIVHDDGSRSPSDENDSTVVALDGKVYVLGGVFGGPSNKVYMWDLAAGKRSWNQVASMQMARSNFACSVMGGKIYVCGGKSSFNRRLLESEVYDPTENKWSFIKPMAMCSYLLKSESVGEELFVFAILEDRVTDVVEAYHPIKDEWRKVEHLGRPLAGEVFTSGGRLYSMDDLGVSIYSFEKNSWMQICLHSFTAIRPVYSPSFMPDCVLAVEDYLLALVSLNVDVSHKPTLSVLRSEGFNNGKKELEWREEKGWGRDVVDFSSVPIHL